MPKVLVSGASGFIASHCILEMLNHGYEVRGTVRNLARGDALKSFLSQHTDRLDQLEFAAGGAHGRSQLACRHRRTATACCMWRARCPSYSRRDENEVIVPARTGTVNVLKAAKANGVDRVVVTSSTAAVTSSSREDGVFTSEDWTDLSRADLSPYVKSKTMAEQAAWEFAQANDLELATVNPALVLGPALEADYGSSLEALYLLMTGAYPMLPRLGFEVVDVRDVAALHRLAFEAPQAAGNRYLCANGFRWFVDIAKTVKTEYPDKKVPIGQMPNWVAKLAGVFLKEIQQFVPDLGRVKQVDNSPAKSIGWQPRSADDAIRDGAKSLVELGIV